MKNSKGTSRKVTVEGKIKLTLSIMLCAYALIISFYTSKSIILPMLFSFFGDLLLMKKRNCFYNNSKEDFSAGVYFFMLAHLGYVGNMETRCQLTIIIIICVIVVLYGFMIVIRGIKNEIIIICLYLIVLISNVVNTFFFNKIAFIGGIIFFISDSLIGIFMLTKKDSILTQVAIWGTYVPAQALMLTSMML